MQRKNSDSVNGEFSMGHEIKPVCLEETIQITAVVIFLCIQSAKKVLLLTSRGQF